MRLPKISEFELVSRRVGIALLVTFACVLAYFLFFGGRGLPIAAIILILLLSSIGGFFATITAISAWRGEASARRLLPLVLACDIFVFIALLYQFMN